MNYQSLLPQPIQPEKINYNTTLKLFSEEALSFIEEISLSLIRSLAAKKYPELTALAFWSRKTNLSRTCDEARKWIGNKILVPRGTAFHISPSNVDTIFVYSWFISLLVGNRNIVRLSGKFSSQIDILVDCIQKVISIPKHSSILRRTLLIKYSPNEEITTKFSSLCDVRVIWGGDSTIEQIRRLPLPATAIDISFANKFSLAIIHSKRWLSASENQKNKWTEAFYNDTYWFNQMACSSPRLVLWIGNRKHARDAGEDLWARLTEIISLRQNRLDDGNYVNKLVAKDGLAIEADIQVQKTRNNDLVRIWLEQPALHTSHHCGAGLFYETYLSELSEICRLLNRTVQTVAYAGFSIKEIRSFINKNPVSGIDRIVPFGQALNFSTTWDGFDLLRTFTREITIA